MSQIVAESIAAEEIAEQPQKPKKQARVIPYQMRAKGFDFAWIGLFLAPFLVLYIGFTLYPLVSPLTDIA